MKKILFLVGESGCGKTTKQLELIAEYPETYTRITSTTTRAPRPGEVDNEDYYFVSEEKFKQDIKEHKFTQWAEFGGNYYGTYAAEYEQSSAIGIMICTPEGILDTLMQVDIPAMIVYFMVSDTLLKEHGVSEQRMVRGNIRKDFMERYNRGDFNWISVSTITDKDL